ncbi:glutamyl-tRNA reductase [Candidatus Marinamargulisbacteria bacterium SCGC AG-333-B06]|nr:glutamyl-tRNA reductase [Candidatus Marinamargulisbacteria bacterium SCGC AG-333-B06]
MALGLLGVDHTQTAIKNIEPIFLNKDGKQLLYDQIRSSTIIEECIILTTCNRVECYWVAKDLEAAKTWLIKTIAKQKKVSETIVTSLLKNHEQDNAIRHLLDVVSGTQSMVFGENEILTQVKQTYDDAAKQGLTGAMLNKCFQTAISVGKRVRAETNISRGAYSVSSIAIEAIRQTQLDYFAKSICIIGIGTMGTRCFKKLYALGHPAVTLCNRNETIINALANDHNITSIPFDKISESIKDFDIIIAATSVRTPLFNQHHFDTKKPYLMIDLGLPRNIDPKLETLANVTLINVDGLKEVANINVKKKMGELSKVNAIINEELTNILKWLLYKQTHVSNT